MAQGALVSACAVLSWRRINCHIHHHQDVTVHLVHYRSGWRCRRVSGRWFIKANSSCPRLGWKSVPCGTFCWATGHDTTHGLLPVTKLPSAASRCVLAS